MEQVITLVKDLGFPIAICLFLAYYIKIMTEQFRSDVKEISGKYETAIEKFTKTLDKNTRILSSLESKLDVKETDDND